MQIITNILIKYGILGIAIAGFSEAVLLPMPMEFIFIPIVLLDTSKALLYSITLIVFSAFGSIAGYYAGKLLGTPLLNKLIYKDKFNKIKEMYSKNAFLTILTSSFTPIPYEAYVISAGAFNINLSLFMTASILSRVIRYLPQGILIYIFGDAILAYIKSYTLFAGMLVFILFLVFKYYFKMKKSSKS
ncbi:YqaA family protein [Clostridium tyrobutyricum]|uniref:YqaA family protein n=1 Tax=Clostridium tyrobutyricum TaxID=1519 RepID=UPI00073D3BE4|nr:VTT domain-containing protein [Clostridium tyrobutyricum]